MTNTCEIVNFLTERYYEMSPNAQLLQNDTNTDSTYGKMPFGDGMFEKNPDTNSTLEGDELSVIQMFEFTFNAIAHLSMIFIMVGMTYRCVKLKFQKTAMHAFLCTLGLYMLTEGVQVRYMSNPIFCRLSPDTKTILHIFLQVTGGLIGLAGTVHKYMIKRIHFNTNHGRFGLVSLAFWCINVIAGLFAVSFNSPVMGILHNIIGLFTYSFFMFAQWIGYESGFFRRNFDNRKSFKWFTIISLFLSVIAPVQLCVSKII